MSDGLGVDNGRRPPQGAGYYRSVRYLLSNLLAFDGSGRDGFVADLVLSDGLIEAIIERGGEARNREVGDGPGQVGDTTVIDGTGLAVAPGFIDVHTHDDFAALVHPDMAFKNRGGVTTCIVGNCGFGAAPLDSARGFAASMHPGYPIPHYDGYRGYMQHLDDHPPGVNIGVLAGHGTIRAAAMDQPDRSSPTKAELATMVDVMNEALDAGVLGISSGLVYEPGRHAAIDELIALARTMAGTGALYATHMRDEGPALLEAVAEAIEIGRAAGVPVQISHHKAAGPPNWGKVAQSLALIEAAQAEGLVVHADQYPYTAGSTTLESVVAGYTIGPGQHDLAPENLVVASCEAEPDWEGQSMAELARRFACSPTEAAQRVLEAARTTTVILHMMDEADVRTVMTHPSTVIGSDGLPTLDGKPHPRLYNTFARVLGHYARDLGLLPLAEAVARMTGRSADIFGLIDRGYLRPGLTADIIVFDPDTIIDRGTFADPNRYPDGIHHVFVNGLPVVRNGEPTGARPGRVLRRHGRGRSPAL